MCKKLGFCLCALLVALLLGCGSRETEMPTNPTAPPDVDAVDVIGPGTAAKSTTKTAAE
ncbi:MAG: hypothetical protein ACYC6N_03170 [Pirellulaceae bacterium]